MWICSQFTHNERNSKTHTSIKEKKMKQTIRTKHFEIGFKSRIDTESIFHLSCVFWKKFQIAQFASKFVSRTIVERSGTQCVIYWPFHISSGHFYKIFSLWCEEWKWADRKMPLKKLRFVSVSVWASLQFTRP